MALITLPGAWATSAGAVIIGGGGSGGGPGSDTTAIHVDVAGEIAGITAKAVPTTSDILVIEDAAAANAKKKITIGDLPAPAADALSAVLAIGNTTGGTDIEVSSGDSIVGEPGSASVGGNVAIVAGAGDADDGGNVSATGGAGSGAGDGGKFVALGGEGGPTGAGGAIEITGGGGGATSGDGGAVVITGGTPISGNQGLVEIAPAIQMTEVSAVPGAAIQATEGRFWVKDDAPNVPVFTDDGGTDNTLAYVSAITDPGTVLDSAATSENLKCARPTQTPSVSAAAPGQVNLQSESVASHGTSTNYATISGGLNNIVAGMYSVVGGGEDNDITTTSTHSVIGGGDTNTITTTGNYNTIGGGFTNTIAGTNKDGNTIAGGRTCIISGPTYATIGGGINHSITGTAAVGATIGGGDTNVLVGNAATIAGGQNNTISTSGKNSTISGGGGSSLAGQWGTISGGSTNSISNSSDYCTIGGGQSHLINGGGALFNSIFAGYDHTISSTGAYNTIVGGDTNQITTTGTHGFIGGGDSNTISSAGANNAILGGTANGISSSGSNNTIGGGTTVTVTAGAGQFIGGGASNTITATGNNNAIAGGGSNAISGASVTYGAIPGGDSNAVTANYGMAAGRRAKANHTGTMVWADSTAADVASVQQDEAHFGVANGVRISHTTEEDGAVKVVAEAATTDDTETTLWSFTMGDNTAIYVSAKIVCMETDGSDRNVYEKRVLVYRDGGGATIQGAVQTLVEIESDAAWDADFDVDTNDVRLRITGGPATTNVNWRATVEYQQVS